MANFKPKPFGEYYLLERIAVGGMAEIFKAKTYGVGGFEKLLAIKRILPHHAQNQDFISMLIDEAKIAVALNHVNIVQVYDLGKIEDDYFIAMEFVDGRDLRTVMRRCRQENIPLTVENAVYIILEICKGLDYAHRKTGRSGQSLDVVHRDISPQNILISFEGEVKIVDFGIAKAANKVTETDTGILKGKFSYMSPEQATGLSLDRRTDIFSTGIIMYELLTGEKLFPGKNHHDILNKIKNTHIEPPFLPAHIPSELEYILAGALAHDLNDRYRFASDFQVELTKFLYSSSLDFTARNLADLMRKLFGPERDSEQRSERVDFEVDEQTRSLMLKSHSESLVSKTDMSTDDPNTGTVPLQTDLSQTRNRTIIKKFQKILKKEEPKAASSLLPSPSEPPQASEPPAQPDRLNRPVPVKLPPPPMPPKNRPEPQPFPDEDTDFLDLENAQSMNALLANWAKTLRELPTGKKVVYIVALTSVLLSLITISAWLSKPDSEANENLVQASPTPQITATPKPTVVPDSTPVIDVESTPEPEISGGATLVNFNPEKNYPDAMRFFLRTSPPGAEVTVESTRPLGVTPLEVYNVPRGQRFNLTFRMENFQIYERAYVVEPGKNESISVKLDPMYGILEVNSTPNFAQVFLNNNYIGQTPLRFEKVPPAKPQILTLKKEGFEEYSVPFRVAPEQTRVFNKVLEKASRALTVQSTPRGAQVFLNGINRGLTPIQLSDLIPGIDYLLVLRMPGYRDYVRKVSLDPSRTLVLNAQLEAQNSQFGTLFIDSDPPGATLVINGKKSPQSTPAVLDRLPTGEVQVVRVIKKNFKPVEYRLKVEAEQITSRKAILERQKGRVSILSNPPNARVFIDDQLIGQTPISFYALDSGVEFVLTVRKSGFQDQIRKIRVKPQEKLRLDISLEPQS